jgi:two-component system chemotaxis sensor kinase CheA
MVDAIETEQEIVLKPIGGLLRRVNNVTGAAILGSGVICIVLDVPDLLRTFRRAGAHQREIAEVAPPAPPKRVVLLAEDSLTTRIQEKRILEAAGYEVVCAVDGLDAWNKLAGQRFDAVISDVEMPNLNGIALAARIREQPEYRELPIVLVTSLSSEADRQKGAEAGANAYITKPAFDQAAFLQILERLI